MKLTIKARKKIPGKQFAGPERSYPIEDKAHARNALARASEMYTRGKLTSSEYEEIRAKAHAKLKGKR